MDNNELYIKSYELANNCVAELEVTKMNIENDSIEKLHSDKEIIYNSRNFNIKNPIYCGSIIGLSVGVMFLDFDYTQSLTGSGAMYVLANIAQKRIDVTIDNYNKKRLQEIDVELKELLEKRKNKQRQLIKSLYKKNNR